MCEDVCPTGAITCGFEIVLAEDQTGPAAVDRRANPGASSEGEDDGAHL